MGDVFPWGEPVAGAGDGGEEARWGESGCAVGADACVAVAFGEAPPIGADDEGEVAEGWEGETEVAIEDDLCGGGRQDVVTTNDVGDAHVVIVNDDGEGIGGFITARDNEVTGGFCGGSQEGACEGIGEAAVICWFEGESPGGELWGVGSDLVGEGFRC